MKQKRKICGNVPVKIPAKWIEIYDCGLCLLASVLIVAGVFSAVFLSGCSVIKKDSSKVMGLEYTVVKEEEIPVELKKTDRSKKSEHIAHDLCHKGCNVYRGRLRHTADQRLQYPCQ